MSVTVVTITCYNIFQISQNIGYSKSRLTVVIMFILIIHS